MDVFKWARERGYEPVIEMTKVSSNFERGNKLDLSPEEIRVVYQEMYDYDREKYPIKTPIVVVPPVYGHPCTLMETSLHITIDGRMILCVGNETISYGNIFTDGLEQALNSPLRRAIQDYRNWIVGPCRDCPYFDYCHGGCRGNAKEETGCPRASNPYCWHHPAGVTIKDMVPKTCKGCLLENNPGCSIKV
jgi:radical SAM protein with 4Fe4S-binding SPASM domain